MGDHEHLQKFDTYFHNLVSDLHRYTNLESLSLNNVTHVDTKETLTNFYNTFNKINDKLNNTDETLFNDDNIILFDDVSLSSIWKQLLSGQKKKVWVYLRILYTCSSMHQSKKKFNPYAGIKGNKKALSVSNIVSTAKASASKSAPTNVGEKMALNTMLKMTGADKMIKNLDLNKHIKNIKPEDIKEMTNKIQNLFGDSLNDDSSKLMTDMLTNITKELKDGKLSDENPIESIMDIVQSVTGKMKTDFDGSNIDMGRIFDSFKNMAGEENNMGDMSQILNMVKDLDPNTMDPSQLMNMAQKMAKDNNIDLSNLPKY